MALSNAERQKRYRQRVQSLARVQLAQLSPNACLTPEQVAERDAVMSEPLYPVPPLGSRKREQIPTFMGWNRYEWAAAPEPLIDHFGMRPAFQRWRAEKEKLQAQMHEQSARFDAHWHEVMTRLHPEDREQAEALARRGGRMAALREFGFGSTARQRPSRRRRAI